MSSSLLIYFLSKKVKHMEISLVKQDIEKLVKDKFEGINEIKIDDNIKVILDVDMTKFTERKQEVQTVRVAQSRIPVKQEPIPEKTLEEKNEEAKAKGLMSSGGKERNMLPVF